MTAALLDTIRQNELRDGYIRLVITRGVGTLGLNPETCRRPSVIIIAASIALYPEELYQRGLDVITCGTRRVSPGALSSQVKSLNYLNNILAKIEAMQAGAGEGLMLNEQGFVAECTGDNIFVLKRGGLFTPPISAGGLRGITRGVVFEIAAEFGISVQEPEMTRYDIYTADECFLTGTAAEIIPVISLDRRIIGSGRPGPETARFIARFRELTQSSGTPIY
jgi:branched-chain amino acid aminotransferase